MGLKGFASKESLRLPSGRIWPTGEFSFGWVPSRPDSRLDDRPSEYCPVGWQPGDGGFEPGWSWVEACRASGLDLRNLPNSHSGAKRPLKYGRQGITAKGRKTVKSVGALIDRKLPRHRVTFATVTMPSLPRHLRQQLGQHWPELVRQLLQTIDRRLQRKGLPRVAVSVTEIQPERLERDGEAYPHLHLMWLNVPGRKGKWTVNVLHLRSWVAEFLQKRGIWNTKAFVNIDVRPVRGKKAAYLAKYLSKGGEILDQAAADLGWESMPSQWWNVTKAARNWVRDEMVEGRAVGWLLHEMVNAAFNCDDFHDFRYLYQVETNIHGLLVNVGWRGCLWDESRQQCEDLFKTLDKNRLTSHT